MFAARLLRLLKETIPRRVSAIADKIEERLEPRLPTYMAITSAMLVSQVYLFTAHKDHAATGEPVSYGRAVMWGCTVGVATGQISQVSLCAGCMLMTFILLGSEILVPQFIITINQTTKTTTVDKK